jgi:HEAT repeat protein
MPSHLRASFLVLALAAAAALLAPEGRAHGGTYRGPGTGLPPGAGPASPTGPATGGSPTPGAPGPATGGDASADLTGWQLWWGLNREPYLALRTALIQGGAAARTGSDPTAARVAGRATDAQVQLQVAPALVAALRTEHNPDIATAALLALAKCGPRLSPQMRADASTAVRSRLADANQEVVETAALALGLLARTADLQLLGDLAVEGPEAREVCGPGALSVRTRAFAVYALGLAAERIDNADYRRWIAHRCIGLIGASSTASRDIPVAAWIALGLIELDAASATSPDDGERAPTTSAAALYAWAADRFAEPRGDAQVRAFAPVTLARLAIHAGGPARADCVQRLSRALESGSTEPTVVRQSCIQGLGLVADGDGDAHDVRARSLLRSAAADGDRLARRFACISIARVGARRGAEGRDALSDSRSFLAGLLVRGSTPERPWMSLALGVGERAAADAGAAPSTAVQDALRKAIQAHSSPGEAGAHFLGLALSAAPSAGVTLSERLGELVDDEARSYAALALGIAGTTSAIEPLRQVVLASRYKPRLLREAAIALGLLGDRSLTPQLVEMLRDARGLFAQSSVAAALGTIGDERAVAPLLALAADTGRDASGRAFAIVALGILCDPAPVPWNTPLALDVNWWLPPATLFEPSTGTGVLDLL